MALPYLEVSHLASSSSFYSSILQPLGLRYLAADREQASSVGTVTYGFPGKGRAKSLPIIQIREASRPFEPVKFSFIVFAAASPAAIADFHDCALAANPWLRMPSENDGFPGPNHRLGIEGGASPGRATVRDLDGNTIQVVCAPPDAQQDVGHVLDWKFDIASRSNHSRTRSQSHPLPSPASSSASSHAHSQATYQSQSRSQASHRSAQSNFIPIPPIVMSPRAPSQVTEEPEPYQEPSVSPRQSSSNNGLSTTNVIGALLGVAAGAAAGAALTYTMVNKERDRRPRHEIEAPPLSRRSTFPEKAPSAHHRPQQSQRGSTYHNYPPKAIAYRPAGAYEQRALPAPYPQEDPFQQPLYEEEYSPRKITYPEQYAPRKLSYPDDYTPRTIPYDDDDDDEEDVDDDDSDATSPRAPSRRPVQYLTEDPLHDIPRSTAGRSTARSAAKSTAGRSSASQSTARSMARSTAKSTAKSVARSTTKSRVPDEIEEPRSRPSSRHSRVSARSRSEAPAPRSSFTAAEGERRSHVGSRYSVASKSTYSRARSQRPDRDADRDSYFSARSRRSSTARHPPPPAVETEIMEAPEVPRAPEPAMYDDYEDYQHVPQGPELVIRQRDGSKFSVTRLSNAGEPPIIMSHMSQAPSHVSARRVALPMSGVGSSNADWDDDDDIISLAPSDSISCVGSKTSRRSRRVR